MSALGFNSLNHEHAYLWISKSHLHCVCGVGENIGRLSLGVRSITTFRLRNCAMKDAHARISAIDAARKLLPY